MKQIIINGVKYTPNVNCFKVRNKWTPIEELSLDTFTKELDHTHKLIAYVDVDNVVKYTSKTIQIEVPSKTIYTLCASKLEEFSDGLVPHPNNPNIYIILGLIYRIPTFQKFTPKTKVYSVTDSTNVLKPYSEIENNLTFLNKYTYGIELETVGVPINIEDVNALGFHELYDGSINGPEYASGVMKPNNFHHLEYFLKLLKTLSKHDHTCSLHVHVGNVQYTSDNLCAIYSLFQRLQEDLNLLIAPYKKDYKFLYNKQKDHCQNLPLMPVVSALTIKDLFRLPPDVSNEALNEYISRSSKWNLLGRYYTVNFLNYICKSFPNNTIELRSLQMTFNYDYVLTWLIINTAIIDYAVNNTKKILDKKEKIQIEDCLAFLIKDEEVLEKVLHNYYKIKNIIYNKKHLAVDLNTNSMLLDDHLDVLKPIQSDSIIKQSNISSELVKIDTKKLMDLKLTITPQHINVGPISVNLQGNYSFPTNSDAYQILENVIVKLEALDTEFERTKKYVILGKDLNTRSNNMYKDVNIEHYVIIDNTTAYYKVQNSTGNIKVVQSIGCNYLYRDRQSLSSTSTEDMPPWMEDTESSQEEE